MKRSTLDKYNRLLADANIPQMTTKSRNWYLDLLSGGEITKKSPDAMLKDPIGIARARPTIGKMYMFKYDPKHKLTLPYYDKFPLIIMADRPVIRHHKAGGGRGFYGLNLHYLRPSERALFFARLEDAYASSHLLNERTRLRISYGILKAASQHKAFAPTFKRYLNSHVKSQLVEIPASHWETALFLPTQQFEKASINRVWSDSRSMY